MIVNCIIVTLIAFALSFVFLGKTILKRECYLSVAFDLSLILIGANWNNIKSFFAIMILLSVLVLYFLIFYYMIYEKKECDKICCKSLYDKVLTYIGVILFVITMNVSSDKLILGILVLYISVERIIFYIRNKSVV
jgi:hypothetical protein